MGYFTENIANETKSPAIVSLSGNPNYIQFESKPNTSWPVEIAIHVTGSGYVTQGSELVNISGFKITEAKTNQEHHLKGTSVISEITDETFYLGPVSGTVIEWSTEQTAESLKNALQKVDFLRNNFEIILPPIINSDGSIINGTIIRIKSKGAGEDYAFSITPDDSRLSNFFVVTGLPENTQNNDSISEGHNPVDIELEIYKNTNVFLGSDDLPKINNMGVYVTTLPKSYYDNPIWFNINSLNLNAYSTDFLYNDGWVDSGTMSDLRFIAKRFINDKERYENNIFYYSNVLYQLTGYKRNLEINDLSEYVYNVREDKVVKPLTNQPDLFYVKGMTQYYNFIFSDPDRGRNLGLDEYSLSITYRIYTQSNVLIGEKIMHEKDRDLMSMVNTIRLNIDEAISGYEKAAIVRVYLSNKFQHTDRYNLISEPLVFRILPECLYKVNDFAFLNSLGGWSSFNFSGTETTDFKASTNSIFKTQTPGHTISGEIESVYSKETDEQFTAETMPINGIVCDWLKELSSSIAVYELSTKRYIIIDELNIKPNTKDELFRLEMKYHYSDRYNALIV